VVDVEARIDQLCRFSQRQPDGALFLCHLVVVQNEFAKGLLRRRIDQVLVDIVCEATIIGTLVEVREVAFVQTEHIVPIRRVRGERHDHLDVAVADDGGIDVHSNKVVVLRFPGAYELIGGKN
jgi:hypothetical protein